MRAYPFGEIDQPARCASATQPCVAGAATQVLVAVHRIVLFDLALEDERQVNERRSKARSNLSVLKLGVHRFLAIRAQR